MNSDRKNTANVAMGIWIENLMDRVRVGESLKRGGYQYEILTGAEACFQFLNEPQTLLIFDLRNKGIEEMGRWLPNPAFSKRIICYFPHLQIELKKNAQYFGIEHVFPRSVFFGDITGILGKVVKQIE